MAAKRLYPRSTVRRIVKAHSNSGVSKDVDILVFVDYTLFIQDLIQEAAVQSKKDGSKKITANGVQKATQKSMRRFKC